MDLTTKRGSRGRARGAVARGIALALAIAAVLAFGLRPRVARADNVEELIDKLEDSSDKVRLSAVLNLTRLGDPRAIEPVVKRLESDGEKKVRSVAAKALGTLVGPKATAAQRDRAVKALQKASAQDSEALVQAQANLALESIGAQTPTPPRNGSSGSGGVYVNIGPMSSKTSNTANNTKFRAAMVKVATKTMTKSAPNMPTTWPGGGTPTKAQLQQKGVDGYYIDGTLNDLTVNVSGATATISCKVSMLLASFPDKSVFGFLNGNASVQGSSSPRDIDLASEDCVAAVVEDLIQKKIVPTIKAKAGIP